MLAALAFALAGVVATGCGSGGSGSGSTVGTQTAGAEVGSRQASTPSSTTASSLAPTTKVRTAAGGTSASEQSSVEAANAICARRNGELAAISLSGVDLHAVAAAARRRARIEVRAIGELTMLTPPAAQAASYRQLVALDRTVLLRVVKVGERAQIGDLAGVRAARAKVSAWSLRLLDAAAHARLRECSGIPGTD